MTRLADGAGFSSVISAHLRFPDGNGFANLCIRALLELSAAGGFPRRLVGIGVHYRGSLQPFPKDAHDDHHAQVWESIAAALFDRAACGATPSRSKPVDTAPATLFQNVRVFDGK